MNAPRTAWHRRAAALLPLAVATAGLSLIAPSPATAVAGPDDTWGHFTASAGLGSIADGVGGCDNGTSGGTKVVSIPVSGLPAGKRITDIVVHLGLDHWAVGDLSARLVAPNGSNQRLFHHTGAASSTVCGDTTNLGGTYTFRDGADNHWWAEAKGKDSSSVMAAGAYAATNETGAAVSLLANFKNVPNVNGTWTIEIDDFHRFDTGSVLGASLDIAVDTTAPGTFIGSGPADGATVTTPPTYTFNAGLINPAPDLDHFECKLDAPPLALWSECDSPWTPTGRLAVGEHELLVRSVDTSGNADATPVSRTFIYAPADTTPPETQITGGPADGATVTTAPTYTFVSPSADAARIECKVDGGAWATCTSPYTVGVATGNHTFSVRAVDGAGNVDPTPATRSFALTTAPPADTTAPDTQIIGGPAGGATVTTAPSYGFTSPDADTTGFRCSVDGGTFTSCTSPTTVAVADGPHTFEVAAVDGAGNVDPTPASRTFTLTTDVSDEQCDQALLDLADAKIWKAKAVKRLHRALDSGDADRIRKARRNLRKAIAAVRAAKEDVETFC